MENIIKDRMKNLMKSIQVMPYYKNYAAASGAPHNLAAHEEAVELVLHNHGFTKWIPGKKEKPSNETVWKWINASYEKAAIASAMPDYSYLSQPCGTHASPDYIIKLSKNIIFGLECKSGEKNTPMYNSGGVKQALIYVFCSNKTNKTTIYVGEDVMTMEQQRLIDELIAKQRALEEEYNAKLKAVDVHHRGFSYYTRPMICQSGGANFIDYFDHPEREQCEANVYTFIDKNVGEEEVGEKKEEE